jgi:hypothetical protein
MNEKKWRLIHDDVVVGLIYNLEGEHQGSVTVSAGYRQLASRRLALL